MTAGVATHQHGVAVLVLASLWFPGNQDPVHWPEGLHRDVWPSGADSARYVVWVATGRGRELAPRTALHLVACRNGSNRDSEYAL